MPLGRNPWCASSSVPAIPRTFGWRELSLLWLRNGWQRRKRCYAGRNAPQMGAAHHPLKVSEVTPTSRGCNICLPRCPSFHSTRHDLSHFGGRHAGEQLSLNAHASDAFKAHQGAIEAQITINRALQERVEQLTAALIEMGERFAALDGKRSIIVAPAPPERQALANEAAR